MDDLERALENVGKDRKEQENKVVLDQLEETLETLLERAGLRA
jgi:molecular chaperone GrpE (heat shock protein)